MQAFVAAVVPTTVTTTRIIVLQIKCDHGTERRKRSVKADHGDNEHQGESEQTGNFYPVTLARYAKTCVFFNFFFYIYLLFLRDGESTSGEGQREKETESEAGSRLRAVSTEPDVGLELTRCDVMT